ncbi:MAG: ABC transporter ATP-binding protein, partial [Candidatus Omnitrophica bacterium CG_4_10_14_0_8_um_filter_44_12]
PSSRKYPYSGFEQEREIGNDVLSVNGLSKSIDGKVVFENLDITLEKGDKVAFLGPNDLAKTLLFQILMGEVQPDSGTFKWGYSANRAYYPRDNTKYFETELNVIDWLRQYTTNTDENFVRGFLGRMLFTGDDSLKKVKVLSGGERVRCMLARMMLQQANVLIFDEPTNHLDLESITSLNRGMEKFRGTILFASQDHELIQTAATRIIEITPKGYIDRIHTTFDEYLENPEIKEKLHQLYA